MDIIVTGEKIKVKSDYNRDFVSKARMLEGKWNSPFWEFPTEHEEEVRELCLEVFGDNGINTVETVDIFVNLDEYPIKRNYEVKIGSLVIARRRSRDSAVELLNGCILVNGGFPSSGGSARNPSLDAKEHTILRIKKFPKAIYEKVEKEGITLTENSSLNKKDALLKEKESLLHRIEEIEKELELLKE